MKSIEKATLNAETLIQARIEQLKKQGMTPRNANECAPMEWDAHTGRIEKRDLPDNCKDPYPALEKELKASKATKAKPKTAKAKAKK